LLAALVAAVGARPALRGQSFGWRQPAAVAVVGLAVVSTVTLAAGWVVRGADRPVNAHDPHVLPLFTQSELTVPTAPRALVLDAAGPVISYALIRRPAGPQLGDADTAPRNSKSPASVHLAGAVRDLVAGRPGAGAELAPFGIRYVVAPTGSAARVSSALGRATTLTVVPAPGATVWRSSIQTGELTLLSPTAATKAVQPSALSAPVTASLPAKAGSADVDGKPLVARTAYGWAQAFELPTSAGRLRIGFSGGGRGLWLIGELVVLLVAVGAMLPGRRPDDEDGAP
jgi:hypothetical protein